MSSPPIPNSSPALALPVAEEQIRMEPAKVNFLLAGMPGLRSGITEVVYVEDQVDVITDMQRQFNEYCRTWNAYFGTSFWVRLVPVTSNAEFDAFMERDTAPELTLWDINLGVGAPLDGLTMMVRARLKFQEALFGVHSSRGKGMSEDPKMKAADFILIKNASMGRKVSYIVQLLAFEDAPHAPAVNTCGACPGYDWSLRNCKLMSVRDQGLLYHEATMCTPSVSARVAAAYKSFVDRGGPISNVMETRLLSLRRIGVTDASYAATVRTKIAEARASGKRTDYRDTKVSGSFRLRDPHVIDMDTTFIFSPYHMQAAGFPPKLKSPLLVKVPVI